MIELIPSKEVREYLKSIDYKLTDFQKATLIWNSCCDDLEEIIRELEKIAIKTADLDLRRQIAERIAFQKELYEKFTYNNGDYIYVPCDEDGCGLGFFREYETALQYSVENGYKRIEKHLLISGTELPAVRSGNRINTYMFPECERYKTIKYDGEAFGVITLNNANKLYRIWSNEMSERAEKTVDSFNPKRFESAYTPIPFPKNIFTKGIPVKDLISGKYGVVATSAEEWEKFSEIAKSGIYVDFSDYAITVCFIQEDGRWSHDHINPIYLNAEMPSGEENTDLSAALEALSDFWSVSSHTGKSMGSEEAVFRNSMRYAKSKQNPRYTSIDDILLY